MHYRYIASSSTDPRYNLALEQFVFDSLPRSESYLMLWQNHNTIVVGRHQNTAAEIDSDFAARQNITVVRRLSGGGAVYHDLGNLNFTLITDAHSERIDLHRFCTQVAQALLGIGVEAAVSGRNDITVAGCKCSGNAQYVRDGRVMHHGTLLFSSDLTVLSRALRADREKIISKGVASVAARVGNIADHAPAGTTLEDLKAALLRQFPLLNGGAPYPFTPQQLREIETIAQERYGQWAWNYGASPPCAVHRKSRIEGCGIVEVDMEIRQGTVAALYLHGDFFSGGAVEELTEQLIGCPWEAAALEKKLATLPVSHYIHHCPTHALLSLLAP